MAARLQPTTGSVNLPLPDEGAQRVDVEIDGRPLRFTNVARVLWPGTGFTKGDMLDYYRRVAPALLPHLAGRPLTMRRFSDGVDDLSWYQTECRGRPAWIPALAIVGPTGKAHELCVVNDVPSLLWVANLATVELHPLLGAAPDPARPCVAVFDLDPGLPAGMLHCCAVALRIRALLSRLGVEACAKTSGTRGLHVYVPVTPGLSYDDTKRFARAVARRLAAEEPELVLDRSSRALRAGKVFVDWSQNDRMKSTVAPYSLCATHRPSVSTPVTWGEIEAAFMARDGSALVAGPDEILRRLDRHGDLFEPVLSARGGSLGASHVARLS